MRQKSWSPSSVSNKQTNIHYIEDNTQALVNDFAVVCPCKTHETRSIQHAIFLRNLLFFFFWYFIRFCMLLSYFLSIFFFFSLYKDIFVVLFRLFLVTSTLLQERPPRKNLGINMAETASDSSSLMSQMDSNLQVNL